MEFILPILLVALFPIAVIYLLVSHSRLRSRVSTLEQQIVEQRALVGAAMRATETAPSAKDEPAPAALEDEPPQDLPEPATQKPAAAAVDGPWSAAQSVARDPDEGAATTRDPRTADAAPPPPVPPAPPAPPAGPGMAARFFEWLRENWFYAISAVSLALAGVFLVQYGSEQGLLPPKVRVLAALAFGAALVAVGEWMRRRYGDDRRDVTAYLPSVFAGAGVVSLFAGILSARMLYGLIGAEVAMVGLVAVALLAIGLGWFFGPLLAGVGIVGAMLAPFVVGGDSDAPYWLYGYFGLIAVVGLLVDAARRWAWVSVLSLVLGFVAATLLYLGTGGEIGFIAMATVLALASIAAPLLSLTPRHAGKMLSDLTRTPSIKNGPAFPTWLAGGAMLAATAVLYLTSTASAEAFWFAAIALVVLFAAIAVWCRHAPALRDLAVLSPLALLSAVLTQSADRGTVFTTFRAGIERLPETAWPRDASMLVALGALLSLLAAWRSLRGGAYAIHWAAAAALIAPVMVVLLDVTWFPVDVMGPYAWALHATALAIGATILATRFAAVDQEARMRTALAVLAALAMMTLAIVTLLSETALTVALALTVLGAAALDRRFNLPPLAWFVQAGVVVLGVRLVAFPGLDWAIHAPLPEVMAAYGGTIVALIAALWLLGPLPRRSAKIVLETGIMADTGILANLLLTRALIEAGGENWATSYWGLSLNALVWFFVAFAQFDRMRAGGPLRRVRLVLGIIFTVLGAIPLIAAATVLNPLMFWAEPVLGLVVLNTLAIAYLLPAVLFWLASRRLGAPGGWVRKTLVAIAAALAALWLALAIRHFWQGPDLSSGRVGQAEHFSYTIAMLLVGAGLIYQSIARASVTLRRAGLVVIGLSVAKVFLVDISGLSGLTRVFSFLALGLALAGLAWLNRWAAQQVEDDR